MSQILIKRIYSSVSIFFIFFICFFGHKNLFITLIFFCCILTFLEWIKIVEKIKFNNYFLKRFIIFLSYLYIFFTGLVFYKFYITEKYIFLIILLICIFSDIGGYVFGKIFGGTKLTKISPNKTISGAIGSFVFSIFIFYIVLFLYNSFSLDNKLSLLWVPLYYSLICQLGDLFISFFKRKARIKDTGKLIPGHGGILDRIDGIIFAIPVGTYILSLFIV